MNGLAPYIAAGFAAALALTTMQFSLAGAESVRQPGMLRERCDPAAGLRKAVSATDFGARCFATRAADVELAGLVD